MLHPHLNIDFNKGGVHTVALSLLEAIMSVSPSRRLTLARSQAPIKNHSLSSGTVEQRSRKEKPKGSWGEIRIKTKHSKGKTGSKLKRYKEKVINRSKRG